MHTSLLYVLLFAVIHVHLRTVPVFNINLLYIERCTEDYEH